MSTVSGIGNGMDLRACISRFLDSQHLTDVTFSFRKHLKTLGAHKLILSMRSEVFEAMFFGPMASKEDVVAIEDISPNTFGILLKYIYTDDVELTIDEVIPCLYAARKYMMDGLVKLCAEFLSQHISEDNVCYVHEQASLFQLDQLSARCYAYIIKKANILFDRDIVLELPVESIQRILEDEQLFTDEVSNFKMLLRWSEQHCLAMEKKPTGENMRTSAGRALFAVRFPLMTPEEFASHVAQTGILTKDEQLQMYYFLLTKKSALDGKVAGFISLPRLSMPLMLEYNLVKTLATSEQTDGLNISFTSSDDLKIVSFEFHEDPHSCDIDCSIETLGDDETRVVSSVKRFCVNMDKKMVVSSDFVFKAGQRYWLNLRYPREFKELGLKNTSAASKIIKMTHFFGSMTIITEEIFNGLSSITVMKV